MNDDRVAILARASVPWRPALLAALLSLSLGAALLQSLAGVSSSPSLPTASSATPRERLSSLPLLAQAPVSTALGAADPRYLVGVSKDGYQAVNPAQRLSARFERSEVLLSSGSARASLSLRSIGYGASLSSVESVQPRVRGNRVLYSRDGLSEWYANGPLGLEQGFTIARAPAGRAAGPLTLSMALSGGAHAALIDAGRSILLSASGRRSLKYGDLVASDAQGRALHSSLAIRGGQLLLEVDAKGARYPLRIDPLVQQGNKIIGQEEEGKRLFGYSVALSENGSTAVVGAPKEDEGIGAAWVFVRSGGEWVQQAKFMGGEAASEGAPEKCGEEGQEEIEGCGFGRGVALSADGNTALIGAPRALDAAGEARVFTRAPSTATWSETATLTGIDEVAGGRFGKSVALSADGKTALVGAPAERDAAGLAWVFTRPSAESSAWSQGEKISGGTESSEAHFGISVALSANGTTALVGGPTDREPTGPGATQTPNAGGAWVFVSAAPGSPWVQQGPMLSGGAQEKGEGHFGYSVALSASGDTALVGARADNEGDGAAWAFARSPAQEWTQPGAKLTEPGEGAHAELGYSVALAADGRTALIGSPKVSEWAGAALVFTNPGTGWSEQEQLMGGEEDGTGWFGASVALAANGEQAILGGPTDSGGAGAVWSFAVGPAVTNMPPTVTNVSPAEGPTAGGTSVTITGTNLNTVSAVRFGATSVLRKNIDVVSPTSIVVTSPSASKPGTVDVTVSAAGGTSAINDPGDNFTYLASQKANKLAPTIVKLSPSEGEVSGGTPVTINGSNLNEVDDVKFGSTAAASFTVNSSTSITAVSPAEAAGTVDVRVSSPSGISPVNANDQFTFTTAAQIAGVSGGTAAGGGTSGSSVLAFGPLAGPSCAVALRSKNVTVKTHYRASVRLVWNGALGAGTCSGKLTIKAKLLLKGTGAKKRFIAKTIAVGGFSLAPGASKLITAKLNATGKRLLLAHHGRLSAKLVILEVLPGPTRAHSAIVHLALQKAHTTTKAPGR